MKCNLVNAMGFNWTRLLIFCLLLFAEDLGVAQDNLQFIQNEKIKLGVSLDRGGAIGFLSDAETKKSVINIHDEGRWVGQSYYSGPIPFGKSHKGWPNWPWNPVSAGDVYGNKSKVVSYSIAPNKIYVKSIPKHWALNNVDGQCSFESWISIDKNVVNVRHRLTNHRPDKKQYGAMDQELPFLYSTGDLHRLISYTGKRPFENKPTSEIPKKQPIGERAQWTTITATEHWAALVNEKNWGLGVIHPGVVRFIGGYYGVKKNGGPEDDPAGYVAAVRKEILDHNIVYEFDYKIVLGTVSEIRKVAGQLRPIQTGYHSVFTKCRQHWWFVNAKDQGFPISKRLRIALPMNDPQLIGPESFWRAECNPKLFVRAAFQTKNDNLEIFWRKKEQSNFAVDQSLRFKIKPDGKLRDYVFDLSQSKTYKDAMIQLRLDPVEKGGLNEFVDIHSITFHKSGLTLPSNDQNADRSR